MENRTDRKITPQTNSNPKPAKIKFSPLHEGMGFHPFSDGLPYAPESKTKFSGGAGATSAGRPTFAVPTSSNQQNRPMGTARQLQQQQMTTSASVQKINPSFAAAGATAAGPAIFANKANASASLAETLDQAIQTDTSPGMEIPTSTDQHILRRRFFAYLMDSVIHAGFWLGTNLAALFFFKFQLDSEILRENFVQFLIFFAISQWLFVALQEMLFETSIGKAFFSLEFRRNHGSLLLRSLVFVVGVLFLGLGLFLRPQDRFGQLQLKQKIYSS